MGAKLCGLALATKADGVARRQINQHTRVTKLISR